MTNKIRLYEELSMNAHPSLQTHLYDGWVLRFANGYTSRANSVNPLYPSAIAPEEKIAVCEERYQTQKLPVVFKLTPVSEQGLDGMLAKRGYKIVTPTNLMTGTPPAGHLPQAETAVTRHINEIWRENYFRLNGIRDSQKRQTASAMQRNIQNKVLCGMITERDKAVACGLCVVEREYAGLFDIVVNAAYRRKGYGYELCASLLNAAGNTGASKAYLQVDADNQPAIALYRKLGLQDCYQYWYRII